MRRLVAIALAACGSSADPPAAPTSPPATAPPVLPLDVGPPHERIVAIGRGDGLGCAVRASGAVDCWGALDGPPHPRVRRITGVTDAIAMAPNAQCVLRATGDVACLARDRLDFEPRDGGNVAKLGSGGCDVERGGTVACTRDDKRLRVEGVADAASVTSVDQLVCVVRTSGEVACGFVRDGVIRVQPLAGLERVHRFVLDDGIGCAIAAGDGRVRCVAIEARDSGAPPAIGSAQIATLDPAVFAHATELVVRNERPWEPNTFELEAIVAGGKVARYANGAATILPGLVDATQLVRGCALRASGGVACWGSNEHGALGLPTTIGRNLRPPKRVVGLADVAKLALGRADSWAVTSDHHVFHWGAHPSAGWAQPIDVPPELAPIRAIVATELGSACVIGRGDAVWCWTIATGHFTRLPGPARALARDGRTLLALHDDGSITRLQIDPPDPRDRPDPTPPPPPGPTTIAITSGGWLECALARDGTVACGHHAWQPVAAIANATQLVSAYFACAVSRGTVQCWNHAIVTDSATGSSTAGPATLEKIPTLANVTDVATSFYQTCAVHGRGTVSCWRRGDAEVVIASGALDVELGPANFYIDEGGSSEGMPYGCAIMVDHTVTCWGANVAGELGDGSVAASAAPCGVPGL